MFGLWSSGWKTAYPGNFIVSWQIWSLCAGRSRHQSHGVGERWVPVGKECRGCRVPVPPSIPRSGWVLGTGWRDCRDCRHCWAATVSIIHSPRVSAPYIPRIVSCHPQWCLQPYWHGSSHREGHSYQGPKWSLGRRDLARFDESGEKSVEYRGEITTWPQPVCWAVWSYFKIYTLQRQPCSLFTSRRTRRASPLPHYLHLDEFPFASTKEGLCSLAN